MGHRFKDASLEAQVLEPLGIIARNLGGQEKEAALRAAENSRGVLLGPLFRLDSEDFQRLPECQVVVRYGVGVDNIDVDAAIATGIAVCYVPDYGVEEVANHSLALLLASARQLDHWACAVREGKWGISLPKVKMQRLSTSTLGVIGAGRIGQALIQRAKPIWKRILVYDPYIEEQAVATLGAQMSSLEDLLTASEFVSVHVPSNPETRGLLSEVQLQRMPPGAILVNCSRGDVIDEQALARLLEEGHLQRAGLDVFVQEPPDQDGLVAMEQVWPTPHVAYLSEEAVQELRRSAAREAGLVLQGEQPIHPVALPEGWASH
jgi:phosphoglycerate dehydrogenase-like enzyme